MQNKQHCKVLIATGALPLFTVLTQCILILLNMHAYAPLYVSINTRGYKQPHMCVHCYMCQIVF